MEHWDILIIGGGPAGYRAGERAAEEGLRAVVVEKRAIGGVCLNEGCIPTKTLLHAAKIYDHALRGEAYGVLAKEVALDHAAVLRRKDKVVKKLTAGIAAKLRRCHTEVIFGQAVLQGRRGEDFAVRVGERLLTAANVLIAAGSEPVIPPIEGVREALDSGRVMTSREILELDELPQKLAVIGGGVIGLELAHYFNAAGCEVSVIEMADKVAGAADREVSAALQKAFAARGIHFYLGSRVERVKDSSLVFVCGGERKSTEADRVLLCAGRRPASAGLGLETVGVRTDKGAIVTDAMMRTSVDGIYAAGDINGKSLLAHTAYREAEIAIEHMAGKSTTMSYRAIPSVIYADPEAVCIGETQESAEQKGIAARTVKLPMTFSGRYVAETERGEGFCKLILDSDRGVLLGAHLVGSYVSEMAFGLCGMIERATPLSELREMIFPHPTVSEIIRETLFEL